VKWLVWLYPPPWRRRYGDEFLALVEARGLSFGTALDLLGGAFDAWLHPDLGAVPAAVGASSPRNRSDAFTRRSKTVLGLAEQEAKRLRSPRIGTEHLLLGLLLESEGVAAHVLRRHGIQPDELRSAVVRRLEAGATVNRQLVGLGDDAKRAIELSVAEANRLRHRYIGTEHLLLGLVAQGQGIAADELRQRNVEDLAELRKSILRVLNEEGPQLRPPT
jgi:hypothetical protein